MASPANEISDKGSDYGSDFSLEEEEIINKLLSLSSTVAEGTADNPTVNDVESHSEAQDIRALARERQPLAPKAVEQNPIPVEASFPPHANLNSLRYQYKPNESPTEPGTPKDGKPDTRSPLKRFRTAPKKSLSVTDITSPSWCELQYWFTLTTHGGKVPTAAMKKGTAVHQALEDQIYTTIEVYPETGEDAFGLRIWNIIQGLRTLQEIGMTRELEVWGSIEGQIINGVIDELSVTCPDEALERELESSTKDKKGKSPANQTTLADFYKAPIGKSEGQTASPKVYICDVKTRVISSLPRGAAFRPTKIQLMIYHRLLGELATNEVDLSTILNRYTLNGNAAFSDSFIAQIGSLNNDNDSSGDGDASSNSVQRSSSSQTPSSSLLRSSQSNQVSLALLLEYNSISQLWALMIREFRRAFPAGKASVGNLLRAEYRSRTDGSLLGSSIFPIDDAVLNMYLSHVMKWWRGEREPEGVVAEEAYKCRSCEFADSCEWRLQRAAPGGLQQAWGRTQKSLE